MPKVETFQTPPPQEKLEIANDLSIPLSEEVLELARQLSAIHGKVRVARESSGVHLYMASPECLMADGPIEFSKMHLALNADKWQEGEQMCALCMKTWKPFSMIDLLSFPPLAKRGYENVKSQVVEDLSVNDAFLEDDGKGNKVPKSPGKEIEVFRLPQDHPAQVYLRERKYNVFELFAQFYVTFCDAEREDVYYRDLVRGFKATPQGRIVFHARQDGISRGWQARVLELERDNRKWYFHPYAKVWMEVLERDSPEDKWRPLPGWEGWDMPKYIIGRGAKRNRMLMGYDGALAWNKRNREGMPKVGVLTEGPLDAARVGCPGMALLGKFMSAAQAEMAAKVFDVLLYVGQNDEAGESAKAKVAQAMSAHPQVKLHFVDVPAPYKDLGEIKNAAEARSIVQRVYPVSTDW